MTNPHPTQPAHTGRRALLCLALSVALLGACSTTPPVASGMSSNPDGTVTTFHRKSSGSLGAFDGPVVWTQTSRQWNGTTVVAVTAPQAGTTLHDPQTHAMLAVLGGDGKPTQTFEPPVGLPWPLQVGKTATSQHKVTVHANNRTVDLTVQWKVESWGDVTVPAGTFKAYKVVTTNQLGETEIRWVSPASHLLLVKRHVERSAAYPQGAGVLDAELLSVKKPGG
jgi:hypothetical protein